MGFLSQVRSEKSEKSAVEKLREKQASIKETPEVEAAPAPKPVPKPVKKSKKAPVKEAPKAKKEKVEKKPAKTEKKPVEKKERKKTGPISRTRDRDSKGDGLRPVERDILKIVEKAPDGISIKNIAAKLFKKPVSEISNEGDISFRTVRNSIRAPLRLGLLEMAGRATVKVKTARRNAKSK